jgi:hypothetical protein
MTDLLTARITTLQPLFQLGCFRPAAVQRDYQWDEVRAERLLHEITEAMLAASARTFATTDGDADVAPSSAGGQAEGGEESDLPGLADNMPAEGAAAPRPISAFYVGVMVLRPAGVGAYEIFDGLQRLTTLTILISVLRDLIGDAALKQRLHAAVAMPKGEFRLRHAGSDTTLPEMIQTLGQAGIRRQNRSRPATESARHVFDVARRFVVLLQRRGPEELSALAAFVLDCVLAGVVETKDPRLARHIFVATNLYGLPLRRDEVFKGQILALASNAESLAKLEASWNVIREAVGQDRLEEFLIAFDSIWRRQPQSADCLGDLVDHLASSGEVTAFMAALGNYARAWRELEGYLKTPTGGPLGNHVWRLNFFKWKEWRPLALHWLERHLASRDDKRHYAKTHWRFAELNRRCMAVTLYEFGEEKRAEMFLKALQLALRKRPGEPFSKRPQSLLPLDFSRKVRGTIKSALTLPIEDYEVRRSLILWYEATLWSNDLAPGHIMGGSVEHILPDKPDLRSQWLRDFPNVEERYFMHSSIGNLALVDWPVNPELANKDFVHKKPILESKGQFAKYKCLADVATATAWTPVVIQERARAMAPRIWAELNLPEATAN